jgi:hypothetical protein
MYSQGSQQTSETDHTKLHPRRGAPKATTKVPVLLLWKDSEIPNNVSRLFMVYTSAKADSDGADDEMNNQ